MSGNDPDCVGIAGIEPALVPFLRRMRLPIAPYTVYCEALMLSLVINCLTVSAKVDSNHPCVGFKSTASTSGLLAELCSVVVTLHVS